MGLGVSRVITRGMSVLGMAAPHKGLPALLRLPAMLMSIALRVGKAMQAGRVSPHRLERERFEGEVRNQFLKLKEKGLGIRVFTL